MSSAVLKSFTYLLLLKEAKNDRQRLRDDGRKGKRPGLGFAKEDTREAKPMVSNQRKRGLDTKGATEASPEKKKKFETTKDLVDTLLNEQKGINLHILAKS